MTNEQQIKWIIWILISTIVVLVAIGYQQRQEWSRYKTENNCVKFAINDATTKMHIVGKTGYRCNNEMEIFR